MYDSAVPISRVFASVLWIAAAVAFALGWILFGVVGPQLGLMVLLTATCILGLAGLLQIRCWTIRVCVLVRGPEREGAAQLHTLR